MIFRGPLSSFGGIFVINVAPLALTAGKHGFAEIHAPPSDGCGTLCLWLSLSKVARQGLCKARYQFVNGITHDSR